MRRLHTNEESATRIDARRAGEPIPSFEFPHRPPRTTGVTMTHPTDRTWPSRQNIHTKGESQDASPKNSQGPSVETAQPDADGAFQVVFDTSSEALLLLSRRGDVLQAYPRACEMLRCKRGGARAAAVAERLAQQLPQEFAGWCASLADAEAPSMIDGLAGRISSFAWRKALWSSVPNGSGGSSKPS